MKFAGRCTNFIEHQKTLSQGSYSAVPASVPLPLKDVEGFEKVPLKEIKKKKKRMTFRKLDILANGAQTNC